MNYRPFGRTGIKVSPYCLGAMMFGAIGNPDHEEYTRIIHKAFESTSSTQRIGITKGNPRRSSEKP